MQDGIAAGIRGNTYQSGVVIPTPQRIAEAMIAAQPTSSAHFASNQREKCEQHRRNEQGVMMAR